MSPEIILFIGIIVALAASLTEYVWWSRVLLAVRSHLLPVIKLYNLESIPVSPRLFGAITFNKAYITMCIRYDYTIPELSYVMLHEYAHVINTTVGHPSEFWSTFDKVLAEAKALGIEVDYRFATQPYCA
jgi:hypothetical protein